ncbi:hypothetical protein PoB_007356000 [Plakobranchus ocellatus]|uniref:Secreted protein n=1 Tax=Plakobranchus ocellatus TaxID=259542 RepID=A0AAV4DSP9_9GAST|nr:hypothetical protein PoB_007356000 [Plakobranchus ocellatus]
MKLIVASLAICFFAVYANGLAAAGGIADDVKQEDVDEDIVKFAESLQKTVKKIDEKIDRNIQAKLNAQIDAEDSDLEMRGQLRKLIISAIDRMVDEAKNEHLTKGSKLDLTKRLIKAMEDYKSLTDVDLW